MLTAAVALDRKQRTAAIYRNNNNNNKKKKKKKKKKTKKKKTKTKTKKKKKKKKKSGMRWPTDLDAKRASPIHAAVAKQLMHGASMAWPAGGSHQGSNATVISMPSFGEP